MEKLVLFFCDIQGTYSSGTEENKRIFCSNLKELKKTYNVDKVLFSFITGDSSIGYLKNSIDDIKKYLDNDIMLGAQFYYTGYINEDSNFKSNNNSKPTQIVSYIQFLKKQYDIEKVFFADDRTSLADYNCIQDSFEYDLDLTLFVPGKYYNDKSKKIITSSNYGLKGVNDCLKFSKNPDAIKECDLKNLNERLGKIIHEQKIKEAEEKAKKQLELEKQSELDSLLEEEKLKKEKLKRELEKLRKNAIFNSNTTLEEKEYFDYLNSKDEEKQKGFNDKELMQILDKALDSLSEEAKEYIKRENDLYATGEFDTTEDFINYYFNLIYEDAVIEKPSHYNWYDEEKFIKNLKYYKEIVLGMKISCFYPDSETELNDLLYGCLYDCYDGHKDYKESNSYTVREMRYILLMIPNIVFLMQYGSNIKFSRGKYKVECNQKIHSKNNNLVVYNKSKQVYCPSYGNSMSILHYILENELKKYDNAIGVFELMDTLIDSFKIENIELRNDYVINENLKHRISVCLRSDSYKSFVEDEESYYKTKKIIPKYRK